MEFSRRELVRCIGATGMVGVSGCLGGVRERAPIIGRHSGREIEFDDEATFRQRRGDPRGMGHLPTVQGPRDGVETGWEYQLMETEGYPLIYRGTVFVGSKNGLYALDGQTGEKQWRFQPDSEITVSPLAVQDSTVLATHGIASYSNPLFALDTNTGNLIWETDVTISRCVFADEYLYHYDRSEEYIGRVALDSGDSEEVVNSGTLNDPIVRSLKYDTAGDRLVLTTRDNGIVFVEPDSGEIPFFRTTVSSDPNKIPVALDDSTIYYPVFANDEQIGLEAIDIESGEQLWTWTIGNHDATAFRLGVESIPAVTENRVFVFGTNYVLAALDKTDGTEQWAVDVFEGPDDYGGDLGPIVAGDTVYVAIDNEVHAYDTETGDRRWLFEEFGTRSSLAVAPGVLVVDDWDGPVYTLTGPR